LEIRLVFRFLHKKSMSILEQFDVRAKKLYSFEFYSAYFFILIINLVFSLFW